MEEKEIEIKLSNNMLAGIFAAVVVLAFLYINESVTLASPLLFGDEGFHALMPEWMAEHREIPVYSPLSGGKLYYGPYTREPFPHLLYGGALLLFGANNEGVVKFLIPTFSLLGGLLVYLFAKKAYSRKAGLFAALLYVAVPSAVTYGTLLYADSILLFLFAAFMYGYQHFAEEKNMKFAAFTGTIAGLIIMTKQTGVVMVPVLFLLFLLAGERRKVSKYFAVMVLLALLVGGAYQLRQAGLYGGSCNYDIFKTAKCSFGEAPAGLLQKSAGELEKVGSNAPILQTGVFGYTDFAYGSVATLLFIAGIVLSLYRRNKLDAMLIIIFFASVIPILYQSYQARIEDLSRYLLPLVAPMAVMAGVYCSDLAGALWPGMERGGVKKAVKYVLLAVFVLVVLYSTSAGAAQKAETMKAVKQFSPGFAEAGNWIRYNTPGDSVIMSMWAYQTMYLTRRNTVWGMPETADILLDNNDSMVVPLLKRNGINYILIAKFSIRPDVVAVSYPLSFVQYLSTSPHFSKVYENDATLLYGVKY